MKKRILLVGGIDKTKSLAVSLIEKGYAVYALNNDQNDCKRLSDIPKLTVFFGDGTDPLALESAYISSMDIVIALTRKDEDNLVICMLSKKKYHVAKTVSLVSDINKMDFFYKMGVDSVVCAISAITNIIEKQAIVDKIANVIPIGEGLVQIAEVVIPSTSPVIDKKLWEISLPKEVIVGCIIRGEDAIIPRGETRILEKDTLVLIASGGKETKAIEELTGR